MKEDLTPAAERYELSEEPSYQFNINRRKFFKVLGGGVAVALVWSDLFSSPLTDEIPATVRDVAVDKIGAWLHIGESGIVTVFTGKVEVGQNIRTSLAQIVAEELKVPVASIEMVMGDTELTPYDRGTFGSLTTPVMGPQLRKVAASARELLLKLAAKEWNVDVKTLKSENGSITNPKTRQTITYGSLTKGKELIETISEAADVTPVEQWKVAGTSVSKVNGGSYVTGRHKFVSDMNLPGMLYGKILRPPVYGATLESVDLAAARGMNGVVVVYDGDFVGVAAESIQTANNALKVIQAKWKNTSSSQPSRQEIFSYLKQNTEQGRRRSEEIEGDVDQAYAKAGKKMEQSFTIDYIAHAPLEPRAGVAQWEGDKLTVWTGTQRPFGVQEELARAFSISKENIRVIMPDTGSGYGGKHTGEAGIEAARLAKEAKKPVKVVWTREEEFVWAYFRPAGVIDVKSAVGEDGVVTSWEFHNYNSGGSGIETQYVIANKKIQFHPSRSPLRQGSYRGLASTANVFARECIMNDLAELVKMDSLEFRLKNLKDERLRAVLEEAARAFGWGKAKPSRDHGVGIACGHVKGSYIATCAEVVMDKDNDQVKVTRVVSAFECGAIINPNHLENQIEGAVVQGLGGALFEVVDFQEGKILNPSFSRYRVPRFKDMPVIKTVMVNRKDIPSVGAGETPIVGIAPAIRNAIAHASGRKLYSLPLIPNGLKV